MKDFKGEEIKPGAVVAFNRSGDACIGIVDSLKPTSTVKTGFFIMIRHVYGKYRVSRWNDWRTGETKEQRYHVCSPEFNPQLAEISKVKNPSSVVVLPASVLPDYEP